MTALTTFIHHRGVHAMTVLQALALTPPVVLAIVERGFHTFQLLVVAAITALVWEAVFAALRRHPIGVHGLTTAMIVTVFTPADLPLWQLSVAVSLGAVIGELIFGGRDFGFLNAAAVSLALLVISFPGIALSEPTMTIAIATLPGAAVLLVSGLVSWRVIVAVVAGFALASLIAGDPLSATGLFVGLVFGTVFLLCDPVAAASTGPGRFVYGLLAGALIVLFNMAGDGAVAPEAIVSTAVLASVFAPMIDHLVVLANAQMRSRRHV